MTINNSWLKQWFTTLHNISGFKLGPLPDNTEFENIVEGQNYLHILNHSVEHQTLKQGLKVDKVVKNNSLKNFICGNETNFYIHRQQSQMSKKQHHCTYLSCQAVTFRQVRAQDGGGVRGDHGRGAGAHQELCRLLLVLHRAGGARGRHRRRALTHVHVE